MDEQPENRPNDPPDHTRSESAPPAAEEVVDDEDLVVPNSLESIEGSPASPDPEDPDDPSPGSK